GTDENVGQHGAERPAAAQGDVAGEEFLLAGFADAGEAHLPRIAFERVGVGHYPPIPFSLRNSCRNRICCLGQPSDFAKPARVCKSSFTRRSSVPSSRWR